MRIGIRPPAYGLIILLLVFIGCAQIPKETGFGDVQKLVNQRVDYRLHWNQGSVADEQIAQAIENLLKVELSVDAAVQIALLNNQNLQAIYEKLGINRPKLIN